MNMCLTDMFVKHLNQKNMPGEKCLELMKTDLFQMKPMFFAIQAHNGQYRKGTKIPYIVHPFRVSMHIYWDGSIGYDLVPMQVALFHDILEDTEITDLSPGCLEGDAEEVTRIVQLITKKKGQTVRDYYDGIETSRIAKGVKLYDRIDNLRDEDKRKKPYRLQKRQIESTEILLDITKDDNFTMPWKALKYLHEKNKEEANE